MIRLIILAFSLTLSTCAFCASPNENPIDVWYAKAIDQTGGGTVNMLNVNAEAYRRWDKELNATYKRLISKLPPDGQRQLVASQRKWLQWRDEESKLQTNILAGDTGTLALIVQSDRELQIIRQRALDLLGYESLLEHPP